MKAKIFTLLTLLLIALPVLATGQVSIEEFKKMNPTQRDEAIQRASEDQKKELRKIDHHLNLLDHWGGEAGLKTHRESCAACIRGLCFMEAAFVEYNSVWDGYVSDVLEANEKAGMPHEQRAKVEMKLTNERDIIRKCLPIVHALVFHMAASPKALELEKRMEQLSLDLNKRFGSDGSNPYHAATRDELMKLKKQMDGIIEEMKQLPTLSPEQAQKEYDAMPEEKIRE